MMCTTQAYAVHTTLLLRWSKIPGFVNYEYPILQYNDAALRDIMLHLTTTFVGIHALDVLTLQNVIQQHHTEYMSIPTFINVLEDAQNHFGRVRHTIPGDQLFLIATTSMFPTQ